MSKIRVCDICGSKIEFRPIRGYRPLNDYFIIKQKWEDGKIDRYEVCTSCMHKFADFVNQEKDNGNKKCSD